MLERAERGAFAGTESLHTWQEVLRHGLAPEQIRRLAEAV
jgi:hypothetical protein